MAKATETERMQQHPLALQYAPGTMSDEEFEALCADLKQRGQQHPIYTYEGMVLDGMHRYRGCEKVGITPEFRPYSGNDPAGMVIALNVLRRKVGATQRAVAGANLNLEMAISQDEASKRVGVSKLHINLVVQVFKSKNARLIKLLEKPDLTREALYEEMQDAGIVVGAHKVPTAAVSASGAVAGLDAYFKGQPLNNEDDGDEDLIGDGSGSADLDNVLDDAPPTAGGKVLTGKERSAGGVPTTGSRPSHPERRNVETPASKLSQAFRGLTQKDQIDFVNIAWPMLSKAIVAAGKSLPADPAVAAEATTKAISKAKAEAAKAPKASGKGKAAPKAAKAA